MATGCPGLQAINPICQAGGVVSAVASAGATSILGALTSWVADGATWLTAQIGDVLGSTTSIDLGAGWFDTHYRVMLTLLSALVLPLLLGSVLQSIIRQDIGTLMRATFVQLPLAMLLAGGAIKIVQLALAATDSLSTTVASGAGADLQGSLAGIGKDLGAAVADPSVAAFVVLLSALLVVLGALALWIELLLRAAAVYVAVLFLPLALISLVWPAISHWCRRLVEGLAALILSKLVIVAILSLAAGALAAGIGTGSSSSGGGGTASGGLSAVLAGAALLLLAAFSPYTLLRLIPMVESGAVAQLEGVRQRARRMATSVPRGAASFALQQARLASFDPGPPGTGRTSAMGLPGPEDGGGLGTDDGDAGLDGGRIAGPWPGGGDGGEDPGDSIPMWPGSRASVEAFEAVMAGEPVPGQSSEAAESPEHLGAQGSSASPGDAAGQIGFRADPVGSAGPIAPRRAARGPMRLDSPGAPTRADGPGVHIITRDHMGPVIKWIPPAVSVDGTPLGDWAVKEKEGDPE